MRPLLLLSILFSPTSILSAQESAPASRSAPTFRPTASIRGRVVDDVTGEPVPSFELRVTSGENATFAVRDTMKRFQSVDGSFVLEGVRFGRWLLAFAPDRVGRSRELDWSGGASLSGVEIRVTAGATLRGRVLDERGAPVEGAVVTMQPPPFSPHSCICYAIIPPSRIDPEATVDRAGAFSFPNRLAARCILIVRHPDFGVHTTGVFAIPHSGSTSLPDIILARGGRLRGRVKRPDGAPDSRAMVSVVPTPTDTSYRHGWTTAQGGWIDGANRFAWTDSDGRFEIRSLAVGSYEVTVGCREGQPDYRVMFSSERNVITIASGDVKELDL